MNRDRARGTHRSRTVLAGVCLLAAAGAGAVQAQPVLPSGPQIAVAASTGRQLLSSAKVAVFADGGFVVAWTAGDFEQSHTMINARIFARDGSPVTGVTSLLRPFNQRIDDLAVTPDGGFWLVWEQLQGRRFSVLARRYDQRGVPMGAPFLVHEKSPSSRYGGQLGIARDGSAVIGWSAERASSFGLDAMVRFFAPDGTPRTGELRLNADADSQFSSQAVAAVGAQPDGSAWIFGGNDRLGLILQHVTADGTVGPSLDPCRDSPVCASPFGENAADSLVLAMRPDGSFMVAWSLVTGETDAFPAPFSIIVGRNFDAGGTARGAAFQVNKLRQFEESPLLTALPDGRVVAFWNDVTRTRQLAHVFCRTFQADGTPASGDFALKDNYPYALAAGEAGDVIAVFAGPGGSIVARRFVSR